jgi:hypothetical protein
MSAFSLSCAALLLGAPLASLAQSADPAPGPGYQFYGGLALYADGGQALGRFHNGRFNSPVQATLGYQLRPRLAVQVGLAYSGAKGDDSYSDDYIDSNANLASYTSNVSYSRRAYSTSVLARYTLTRKATHRFQVDALGGPSFDHFASRFVSTQTTTSQGTIDISVYDQSYRYNNLLVNLGPSFRYRFGGRVEAVYDLLFNVSLTDNHRADASMALGLRYRFGRG